MKTEKFDIDGPQLIHLDVFRDSRGFFVERYNQSKFEALSLPTHFVQDNFSRSDYGVLRGLHFQTSPWQGKVVTCTRGEIFDVAVDIRPSSKTYGKHVSVKLTGDSPKLFWIPPGFAHGFCVTSKEGADVSYKVDTFWDPKSERCILWNDPSLAIQWPILKPTVSEKDSQAVRFDSISR